MNKKTYLKPSVEVLKIESSGLLAASSEKTSGTDINVNPGTVKPVTGDKNPWDLTGAKGYSPFEDNEGE
jgi:hypothetical protein